MKDEIKEYSVITKRVEDELRGFLFQKLALLRPDGRTFFTIVTSSVIFTRATLTRSPRTEESFKCPKYTRKSGKKESGRAAASERVKKVEKEEGNKEKKKMQRIQLEPRDKYARNEPGHYYRVTFVEKRERERRIRERERERRKQT